MSRYNEDAEAFRRHEMEQAMKRRPKKPGEWDRPANDEEMAYYRHDLERWADSLPDPEPWDDGRR